MRRKQKPNPKPKSKVSKSFHQKYIQLWMIVLSVLGIVLFTVAFYFISRIGIITGHP